MQEDFYRASDAEPTREDLDMLLGSSVPAQWLYDDESNSFTYKENLLIRVAPDKEESFVLYYGHQPALEVPEKVLYEHLPVPALASYSRAMHFRP